MEMVSVEMLLLTRFLLWCVTVHGVTCVYCTLGADLITVTGVRVFTEFVIQPGPVVYYVVCCNK